jgi:uncharacterized protein YcnI
MTMLKKSLAAVAAAGVLVVLTAGVASAHVSAISPDNPGKGGDAEIIFRVPNEEDTASTVKLEVDFSLASPLSNANVRPTPGWTAVVNTTKLAKPVRMAKDTVTDAVASIVWTAQPGTKINPGEFQEFVFRTEGLPTNTDNVVMPAVQTYDNGDVVRWDQPTVSGKPEPDHPVPTLALGAADSGVAGLATSAPATSDGTARWLGIGGIVLAAVALGFGLGALTRRRTGVPTSEPAEVKEEASV